jgi:hypothetical protein
MSISVRKRLAVSAVALGASLLGGAFLHPVTASAAAPAATSCYGGAQNWTLSKAGDFVGPFTTSGRCRDINIRTTDKWVLACVVFIDHTDECNHDGVSQVIPPNQWKVIATDVRDGTRFKLHLNVLNDDAPITGKVAS